MNQNEKNFNESIPNDGKPTYMSLNDAASAMNTGGDQTGSTSSLEDNKGSETQNQQSESALPPKVITLSNGAIAVVKKGLGKHAMMAQRLANGNQEKYLAAMISQLTTINGQPIVLEDLEVLPLADYLTLQAEFAEQNF